jgi:putative ABC transport system permease protein
MGKLQMTGAETSGAEFRDLQSMPQLFSFVAATEERAWTLGGETATRLDGLAVTAEFFRVFDQTLALGHSFDGTNPYEVIVSDGLWQSVFARRRDVIGRKLLLDGRPYQIAGVARASFHFPVKAEAWVPLMLTPDRFTRRQNMSLSLFARLADGVSQGQAQQSVNRAISGLNIPGEYGLDVEALARRVAGDLRLPLMLIWWAALVLLLAACANVAGLLLARAEGRRREIGIRISVGASRAQIVRQLMTESLLIAVLGGATGMLLAAVCLALLKRQPLPFQDLLQLVTLNPRLLVYGLLLSLGSSLVFGITPAIELLRGQRMRPKWFQNFYIAGQVGAAIVLLVLTGLLVKSLNAVEAMQPGFDVHDITTAFLIKPATDQNAFFLRLLERLRASPGVQSAALAFGLPFSGDSPSRMFLIKGHPHQPGEGEWHAQGFQVSSDYFATLHIPLLRGRYILDSDIASAPFVCVIDADLAKRFFPHEDPLGQEIGMYSGFARIVGVVAAVQGISLEGVSPPAIYYSLAQVPFFPQVGVVVRSSVSGVIRKAVAQADPGVPVFDVKSMADRIDASVATRAVMSMLITVFGAISLLLAAIGIHGVLAQGVSERTAEIGIRMALGARPGDIFRRYVWQGLRVSGIGIVGGLCAAVFCGRWVGSFLYEVQPMDPVIIVLGVVGFLMVSGMAVWGPCWRASRVDPQVALRRE